MSIATAYLAMAVLVLTPLRRRHTFLTGIYRQSEVPQATEHGVGQKPWDSLLGTSIVLVNSVNNQALTIDLNNKERIHGYPKHSGKNQQWELSQFGAGFSIRSLLSSSNGEEGLYLSLGDWGGSSEPVVLSPFPVAWDIRVAGDPTQDVPVHARCAAAFLQVTHVGC